MFAKIQSSQPALQPLTGCFVVNQHQNDIHQNHSLPLRKATYHVEIINALSEVTLVQEYQNNTDQFLQILYKFAISPSVCIHRFSATFSKHRIEGIVKQKQGAKKQYSQAVNQGKKAAYGEIDPQSEDFMTLKIGNIDPKQKVTIQIVYIQELSLCLNTFYKFTLPIRNNPRYLNKISKNQFIQSFRKKTVIEEGYFQWDFKITLKSSRKILHYQATSHQLVTQCANDTSTEISLTFQNGSSILDKDFVFIYTTEEFQIPNYTLGRTDNGSTVMVSFIPKFCSLNLQDAKKEAIKADNFETDMDSAKGQYIFLLDRSGSMGGSRIAKAKEALILFLKSLPIDSYFNVGSFGSGYQFIFNKSKKCSTQSISNAVFLVQLMDADMGGTQIEGPLQKIFSQTIIQGYPKLIYFLTDGEVYNTQSIINLVGKNVKYSRVNAIGIGDGASEALIKGCANKGRGHYTFIYNNENSSEKIIQLLNDSLSAVISKVQLNYDKDLVQSIVPNPTSIPYILKGQAINFYITFKGQLQKSTLISFSYEDSQNNFPFKSEINIDPENSSYLFIDVMGHYKSMKALEQAQQNKNDNLYCVKEFQDKSKIIQLSQKYNILSKYTAFLCVEKEIVDGKYQQVKSKGQLAVQIKKVKPHQPVDIYSIPPPPSIPQSAFYGNCTISSISSIHPPPPVSSASVSLPPPPLFGSSASFSLPPPPLFGSSASVSLPPPPLFGSSASVSLPPPPLLGIPCMDFFSSVPKLTCASIPPSPPPSINSQPSHLSLLLNKIKQRRCKLSESQNDQDFDDYQQQSIQPKVKLDQQYLQQISISNNKQQNHLMTQFSGLALKQSDLIQFQHEKKNSIQIVQTKKYNIDDIVKCQQFEGYWSDLNIIQSLFGSLLAQNIKDRNDLIPIITFFVLKWLQKYYSQKEYQLIIKKSANWLKKNGKKDYSDQFKTFVI